MSSKFDFIDPIANRLAIGPFDRSKVIAAAVALVAAYRAPVPSTAVGSVDTYFRDNVEAALCDLLGEMSEACVLDFKFAREVAGAFWRIRYNAAMNPQFPFITDDIGIVDQIVGAGTYLAKDVHCFLNDNKKAILTIALAVWNCVKECEDLATGELQQQTNEVVMGSGAYLSTEDDAPTSTASQTPDEQTAGKSEDTASETSEQGNTVSQEGFTGAVAGWLVGGMTWVIPGVSTDIHAAAKAKREKLKQDIEEISKRIAAVRNGNLDRARKDGIKLPKNLKHIDYGTVIKSAIIGTFFGAFYGAYQGSDLQNLNNELIKKLKELEDELEREGIDPNGESKE